MSQASSPRVLKAEAVRGLGSRIAFNYDDFRKKCDEQLQQVREQARQIIESAQAEAAAIRQQAHDRGLTEGRRDGLAAAAEQMEQRTTALAEERTRQRVRTLLPAIEELVKGLTQQRDAWLTEWEANAIRLSAAIAEKLLHRSLALHPEYSREMLREALELVSGTSDLRIRMNPQDVELLGDNAEEIVRAFAACGAAEIVPDAAIHPGGCVITTRDGSIDGRLETLLSRITDELLESVDESGPAA